MADPLMISLVVTTILTPILAYMAHSRCTKVATPCCTFDLKEREPQTSETGTQI